MSSGKLIASLNYLRDYFRTVMQEERKLRAIFHGAKPLMNKDAVFADITDATRQTWGSKSVHDKVLLTMQKLKGYGSWSVITTCTTKKFALSDADGRTVSRL